jgi:exodeoxyribonuclease V alpha subunit
MDFYAQKFGKDAIVACALSGNASNRIKTVTGYQAFTIHSLLGWNGKYFEYNEENKLPFKLIVLDEASMVDLFLFYSLFKAIDFTKTKLFIIGDNAQLPPVGLGEVFNDILQNYEVEKIILDKVFRQSEKQVINIFAQEIRKGKVPKGYKNKYEDFEFIVIEEKDYFKKIREFTDDEKQELRTNINQKIYEQINSLLDEYNESILSFLQDAIIEKTIYQDIIKLQEYSQRYISMLQIIAPQKKGITGTKELNKLAKSIINPDMSPFKNGINVFDKVIHLENKNKYVVSLEDYFIFKQGVNSVSKEDAELILEKIIDGEEEIKEMLNTQFTRVFNGQTGIVLDTFIYEENKFLSVYYPLENYVTFYSDYEINQEILDLSYAFTIHKSQGSEYLNVIIPVSLSDSYMLNNKLLYTAVTRAKKKLYLIGETYAFSIGVKKKDETVRKTLLKLNAYSK